VNDEDRDDEHADRPEERGKQRVVAGANGRKDGEQEDRDARTEAGDRCDPLPPADGDQREDENSGKRPERREANDLGDRVRAGVAVAGEIEEHPVAGLEESVLVECAASVPLELDDVAAIQRIIELNGEPLELRAVAIAGSEDTDDMALDDVDADAAVGVATCRRRGGERDERRDADPDQRT
jgi:hypothetical protein